ncbi:MAG: hypothetical protein KZQ93_14700 [Candidatus Thiodiazotropha sp. (ex Monitilora ramsayi)]|nr:hypothetical protein [Candidatus Thiodiazotropha sp. (ex Monitilora ramsayi)]
MKREQHNHVSELSGEDHCASFAPHSFNVMHKKYMKHSSSTAWLDSQLRATNALVKFCEEHDYKDERMSHLKACLKALETKAINKAVEEYRKIPLGGNGCFNDWWPDSVYEHETEEYVEAVFQALIERWSRLMKKGLGDKQ